MKRITSIVVAALALLGAVPVAEARSCGAPTSYVYISGYRSCGTPVYTERFLIRRDRYGRPVWGYRVVSAPRPYVPPIVRPPVYRTRCAAIVPRGVVTFSGTFRG